ncbi:MAG: hypothetical protein QHG94_08310 [Candidatus Methanosuratincola sp.]|nr:hypothetical protein [Candidatus Methanosuratincola sp.]
MKLGVTAEGALESQVTSYITREIRSLGDVAVYTEDPTEDFRYDFLLGVAAVNSALACSVCKAFEFDAKFAGPGIDFLTSDLNRRTKELPEGIELSARYAIVTLKFLKISQVYRESDVIIVTWNPNNPDGLRSACKKVVATIDGGDFKKKREFAARIREIKRMVEEERAKKAEEEKAKKAEK